MISLVIFHAFSCKTVVNVLLCLFSIPEALYRDYPLWQDDMDAALPLDALMRMMEKLAYRAAREAAEQALPVEGDGLATLVLQSSLAASPDEEPGRNE